METLNDRLTRVAGLLKKAEALLQPDELSDADKADLQLAMDQHSGLCHQISNVMRGLADTEAALLAALKAS